MFTGAIAFTFAGPRGDLQVEKSRNKELRDLFQAGLGCHHAGMLRSDRGLMERSFEDGAIKVSKRQNCPNRTEQTLTRTLNERPLRIDTVY